MNVAVAARITAFLATIASLIAALGTAHAAPRRVAVINLAVDQDRGMQATAEIRQTLVAEKALSPIPAGDLSRAFEGPVPVKTFVETELADVASLLSTARQSYEGFRFEEALSALSRAQDRLLRLPPDRTAKLLTDANLLVGLVYMGKPDRAQALEAFRLVHALAPERATLDATQFDPVIVQAYAESGVSRKATATLNVSASFDKAGVYIDGKPIEGNRAELPPGIHLVSASFPNQRPIGQRVYLMDGQTLDLKVRLVEIPREERALALRRDALASRKPERYMEASRGVRDLAGVNAVVIVRDNVVKELVVAVYDAREDRLHEWHAITDKPDVVLDPLLPKIRIPIKPPRPPPPPVPWYRKRWGKIAIGSGSAAFVLGVIAVSVAITSGGTNTVSGGCCSFGSQ